MNKQLVWDLPVRVFHWLLVLSLFAQWLTAEVLEGAIDWHFYIGYFTLGLVIFRLIWGIVGTKYAKFNSFIASPKSVWQYFRSLVSKDHTPAVGHNPLGGLLLPAVLILVGLQGISGLFISDDIVSSGPYYESASGNLQKWMSWLHHNIFDVLLGLIVLHLLAIAWYRIALKNDLITPMFSGKKIIEQSKAIPHSKLIMALVIAIAVGGFVYWLVEINPPPVEDYYY